MRAMTWLLALVLTAGWVIGAPTMSWFDWKMTAVIVAVCMLVERIERKQ